MKLLLSSFVLLIFSFLSNLHLLVLKSLSAMFIFVVRLAKKLLNMLFLESKGPTSKLTKMLKPLPFLLETILSHKKHWMLLLSLVFMEKATTLKLE